MEKKVVEVVWTGDGCNIRGGGGRGEGANAVVMPVLELLSRAKCGSDLIDIYRPALVGRILSISYSRYIGSLLAGRGGRGSK